MLKMCQRFIHVLFLLTVLTIETSQAYCPTTCVTCSNSSCTQCMQGYGTSGTPGTPMTCAKCASGCEQCGNVTLCSVCSSSGSTAYTPLFNGSGLCGACSENCAICTIPETCDTCASGYNMTTTRTCSSTNGCLTAINLSDNSNQRLTTNVPTLNDSLLCDSFADNITWYRFGFNKLPEYCPGYDRCGTYSSIWVNGTHPTDYSPEVVQICGSSSSSCCSWTSSMQVQKCADVTSSQIYYVYQLVNPVTSPASRNNCSRAYCLDLVCPAEQITHQIYLICVDKYPKVQSATISWTDSTQTTLQCTLGLNAINDSFNQVTFVFDSSKKVTLQNDTANVNQLYLTKVSSYGSFTNVYCEVQSYWPFSADDKSPSVQSNILSLLTTFPTYAIIILCVVCGVIFLAVILLIICYKIRWKAIPNDVIKNAPYDGIERYKKDNNFHNRQSDVYDQIDEDQMNGATVNARNVDPTYLALAGYDAVIPHATVRERNTTENTANGPVSDYLEPQEVQSIISMNQNTIQSASNGEVVTGISAPDYLILLSPNGTEMSQRNNSCSNAYQTLGTSSNSSQSTELED